MNSADTNLVPSRVSPKAPHLVTGFTSWFHVSCPRSERLARLPAANPQGAAVQALLQWVLHQGALYTLELRMGQSGQHRGIWLGITGRGATPGHAAQVSLEGRQNLEAFFQLNQWKARIRRAPRLPRWSAGLRFMPGCARMDSVHTLLPQRAYVSQLAERGAPLLLQLQMQLPAVSSGVYGRAEALRRGLKPAPCTRRAQQLQARQHALLRNLMDDAADLSVTVRLSAQRPPSSLRLRKFAHAFEGSRLVEPWTPDPTPTPARLAVLRDALALMAGKEAP